MSGLVVGAAVLAAAAVYGVVWRHRTGRLRPVRTGARSRRAGPEPIAAHDGSGPAGAAPKAGAADAAARSVAAEERAGALTAAELGRPLGSRATLVQFSTAFCAPCRATRRILADVAGMVNGVAHVEIDAEANLGLVRSLGVHRTPAVFLLDADGTILRRGVGQPRKPDVIAALGAVAAPQGISRDAAGSVLNDGRS